VCGSKYGSITVFSQKDADRKLQDCSTLVGNLYISSNYSGSLNISTVTNITENLYVYSIEVTDIVLDNLLYLNKMLFLDFITSAFSSLSLARVVNVEVLRITSFLPANISMPSLVNTTTINLSGNFSE
jgi:hypothetical protein